MNATVADILRGAGLVPVVPELSRHDRDKESNAGCRVPAVPAAPVEKYNGAIATAKLRNPEPTRARLVRLAKVEGRAPALVDRLPVADLPAYADMGDAQLIVLLAMLSDDADRERGIVPKGDTARVLCRSCGPVWVHPAIARMLPVVGGWPRALGCPWCFIRARGIAIPRPHVACADCRHRIPDTINPAQGMGRCAVGNASATWPGMKHKCADFRPVEGVASSATETTA